MSRPNATARVSIPATIANMGPGFDCMGMAVSLHNEVDLATGVDQTTVQLEGDGAAELPIGPDNLVMRSALRAFEVASREAPPLALRCVNRIPLSRGLGSSSAAIVGGLVAANELMGCPLALGDLQRVATETEGHPDNVVPALRGGLVLMAHAGGSIVACNVTSPHLAELRCALAIPEVRVSTEEARRVLPTSVPMADAVFNVSRAALMVHALHTGDWSVLAAACQDRLHQPHRAHLIPGVGEVFRAARQAGAHGVFVSGSGPTVCALCTEQAEQVSQAMVFAFRDAGVDAAAMVLGLTERGGYEARE